MSEYDDKRSDNIADDIGQSTSEIGEAARRGYDLAKKAKSAESGAHSAARAGSQAANAGMKAASGASAANAAARASQASAGIGQGAAQAGASAAEAGLSAAAEAATAGAEGAASAGAGATGAAGSAASGAAGPVGWVVLALSAVSKVLTSEDTRQKLIYAVMLFSVGGILLSSLIAATRSNLSLDPIERSVYSTRDYDFQDYPDEETALTEAINAINEGVAESYNRSKAGMETSIEASGLDLDESVAATDYTDIQVVQYNPFRLLSAYQVVYGARDYTPEKLKSILANAELFPYEFTARIPKTKQHLFKTDNTPVARINGEAWDEPIEVPRFYSVFNAETQTWDKAEYDWNAISAGQDWFVVSVNGDTVTIGHPEEIEYTEIKIIRFDEAAALRAIGYDDDVIGDKYIEPDYEFSLDRRERATEATYFENFREIWLWAEKFRSDESSTRNVELANGGITVEVNITEQEKNELLEYCDTIIENYEKAKELEGQGMGFFDSLVLEIENIIRPYVKNIDRCEPEAKIMQEMVDVTTELRGKIEAWKTSEDPSAQTVTADELEEAIDVMLRMRSVAFHTIITNAQRKAIFKATRKAINILDGTHLMALDSYLDPFTGEMTLADYGEQDVDITVEGGMSEAERSLRQKIVDAAKEYLGTPYGTGSGRVDCSMLVRRVYATVFRERGRCMEAVAAGQGKYCVNAGVTIGESSLRPGDLIFWAFKDKLGAWKRPDRYMHISHVGIYVGDGKIIDASSAKGKVVYRDVISKGSIVLMGAPIYALSDIDPNGSGTGSTSGGTEGKDKVPASVRSMDRYGILGKSEVVPTDTMSKKVVNVRYYCSCEKCGYGSTNAYGQAHQEGECTMSRAAAMAFMQLNNTDNDDNDPLGSVVEIDGTIYKCMEYNKGMYEPEGNVILIYTKEHRTVVNKNYKKPTANMTLYRYGE